jgi:hypothetical protein
MKLTIIVCVKQSLLTIFRTLQQLNAAWRSLNRTSRETWSNSTAANRTPSSWLPYQLQFGLEEQISTYRFGSTSTCRKFQ